ncbi:MAG: sulfite exporter TauE/SafE family protein [Acidobacteriota bacterium]
MALLIILVAFLAGAVAAVAGFGIGSFLTPAFAMKAGIELAVAAVAIPHFVGTSIRFWLLRRHLDRDLLMSFGLTSAAGALVGALLHVWARDPVLTAVFAVLLIFSGVMGLSGLSRRLRFTGAGAWIAGAVSGMFGGLVGNQGGIRAAAMLGLQVPRDEFVATATAIALFVDFARMPVYIFTQGRSLVHIWPLIAMSAVAVAGGTLFGGRVLSAIPQQLFHKIVAGLVLLLGVLMLFRI